MKFIKVFTFILFTLASRCAVGQSADSARLQLHLSATGNYLHGNVNQLRLVGAAIAEYKDPADLFSLGENFSYSYLKDGKILKQSDVASMTVARFKIHPTIYPIGILWVQSNRMFDYKGVAPGAGVEWLVANKKQHYFAPSITAWYEWTRFGSTDFKNDRYDGMEQLRTPRLALRLVGHHVFTPARLRFSYNIYGMQSLRWSDNHRIYANTSLEIPVFRGFFAKVGYLYTYESIIIEKRVHSDQALTFGVSYGM